MASYDFQRCNVLLVEDNQYITKLFRNILKTFKFGSIVSASNGEEAIACLKSVKLNGTQNIDIIVSDLVMAPINGLLLLRWVRASKDCPNKMIPFMMLSGAADEKYVNSARDLGVNEFLAKPFSVTSVYERILQLVDRPRQFVTATTYFGPDRRRKSSLPSGVQDRREKKEEDVIMVYSKDKLVKPNKPSDVWYWRLPNVLKGKVSGGAGSNVKGEIPLDLLAEAEEQLERAGLDFLEWAHEYIEKLSKFCEKALAAKGGRTEHFSDINHLSLELRGQGGTFGYPLISDVSKMLYDCTTEGCLEDDQALKIVQHHVDAMRAVLRSKMSGDGGDIGKELVSGLKKTIQKTKAAASVL